MATIDIRRNEDEMVDVIRFSPDGYIRTHTDRVVIVEEDGQQSNFVVEKTDIRHLIQALEKYMELYG